ncbi:unnamed protein product [Cylicocyclus nassatus]|uniref:Uncharacterized protein n=1 Tax=Cylicocyclus nassatus TaxID=53992 RepID=A0AA36M7I6_CYLNA|nr:unnamed protein product [Cylicocyclus nassatus]
MRLRYQHLCSFKGSHGSHLKKTVTALLLLATLSTYFLLSEKTQTVRNAPQWEHAPFYANVSSRVGVASNSVT